MPLWFFPNPSHEDIKAFMDEAELEYWNSGSGTPAEREQFWASLEELWRSIPDPTEAEFRPPLIPRDTWQGILDHGDKGGAVTFYRRKWKKDRKIAAREAQQKPLPPLVIKTINPKRPSDNPMDGLISALKANKPTKPTGPYEIIDRSNLSQDAQAWLENQAKAGTTFKSMDEFNAAYIASQRPKFSAPPDKTKGTEISKLIEAFRDEGDDPVTPKSLESMLEETKRQLREVVEPGTPAKERANFARDHATGKTRIIHEPDWSPLLRAEHESWIHRIPVIKDLPPLLQWASLFGSAAIVATEPCEEYAVALALLGLCLACIIAQVDAWVTERSRLWKLLLAVASVAGISYAAFIVIDRMGDKRWGHLWPKKPTPDSQRQAPPPVYGELFPDTLKTPAQCLEVMNGPRDGVTLILGTKAFFTQKTMIPVLVKGEQVLSISRTTTGGIYLKARIIGFDNKLTAVIEGNKWASNPPESFTLDQPDLHRLKVYDSNKRVLLNAHYMNADTIKIEGRFYTPTGELVVADSRGLHVRGVNFSGGCSADSPNGISLD